MAGDGTEFTLDITVPASGVTAADAAARSVEGLTKALSVAEEAAAAAAAAVKLGEAAYKQAENNANRAAKAVEKLGMDLETQSATAAKAAAEYGLFSSQYQKASTKLQELTGRQAEATTKAAAAKAAMEAEAASLDKLKTAAEKAGKAEESASKSLDKAKLDAGSGKVNEMAEAFGKLGGPLGAAGQKAFGAVDAFKKLGSSLGSAGPYAAIAIAIVAIAAGVIALGAAAVGATVSVAAWAVGLGDVARTQGLLAAGVAQSVKGGKDLQAVIEDISTRVPMTSDELLGLAAPLAKAGLQGKALADALDDAATKAATAKFGPEFAKQMTSLPSLATRLEKNLKAIFSGLKIDALLEGLGKMVALFDANSASANAIKAIFESLFQPLIDAGTSIIPDLIKSFIQLEIQVMKGMIQVKLVWQEWGGVITTVGEALAIVAAVIGGVLVAALVVVAASFGAVAAIGATVIGVITGLIAGVMMLWPEMQKLGENMIKGLVDGLLHGGPQVLSAITGIAGGAVDAAKHALGIASPSKVFAEIGMHTAAGMEQGIDRGASDVQDSVEAMVEPPAAGSTSVSSSTGATYQITIQAGGSDGQSIADALRSLLESLGAQAGTAVPVG